MLAALNTQQQAVIDKYLAVYAEPEVTSAVQLFNRQPAFQHCLCVPFYNEDPEALNGFLPLAIENPLLIIAVVNQPDTLTSPSTDNQQFITAINDQFAFIQSRNNLSLYQFTELSQLLVVDRYSSMDKATPYKQGVGLARKIAADIATAIINLNVIQSGWIHCSDADATLPKTYFSAATTNNPTNTGALVYPFKHRCIKNTDNNVNIQRATELYEQRLSQYKSGLQYANSPYAFYTLGSTLCLSSYHYAVVRGFPKRNAAEDFYILNKLQKSGGVYELSTPEITLQSRLSSRTPFGTGAAVADITDSDSLEKQEIFYHPMLFILLKILLQWFDKITLQHSEEKLEQWPESLQKQLQLSAEKADNKTVGQLIPLAEQPAINALQQLGFSQCLQHCQTHCEQEALFKRHIHEWFDAFRTLKWIHHIRDSQPAFKNIDLQTLNNINIEND